MYYKVASQLAATLHIIYYWILCIARDETQQLDVRKNREKKECDQTSDTTTLTHSFARLVRIHRLSCVIQLSSKHVNTNTKQLRVKLSKNRSHFFSLFFLLLLRLVFSLSSIFVDYYETLSTFPSDPMRWTDERIDSRFWGESLFRRFNTITHLQSITITFCWFVFSLFNCSYVSNCKLKGKCALVCHSLELYGNMGNWMKREKKK